MARTLQARGLLEHKSGNYQNAGADLERSLAIFEAADPSHPDTVLALSYVGEQLAAQGEWLPSRQMLTRAVSMADAVLRPDHPDLASVLRRLAATLTEIGDLTASLELGQRAVRIAERGLGSDHVLVAMQLNDLANTLQLQGDYIPARHWYERARGIYEQRLGADFVGATTATYNLGLLYLGLGDLREARREFQRALETWQRVLGPEHPSVARAYGALATVAAQQRLDSESRRYNQRALTIRERELGVNHILVAITLSRLAVTHARLGELQRASALSARAVKILELSGAQTVLANGLVSHGQIQVMARNYTGAADSYRRALVIEVPLLGSAHPSVAEVEAAYADVQARLDQRQDAFDRTLRADEISRNHSRLTLGYLSERQALDYAASRPPALDLGLSLMSSAEERTRVLDALVRGRALTLDEIASRHRLRATQQDAAMAALWTALTSARQRLANLTIKGPDERRPAQYAALMDEARRDKEQAERRLAEQSAVFGKELAQAATGLDRVRAALPSGSALVSFVRYEHMPSRGAPAAKASSSSQPVTRRTTAPAYLAFVLRADKDEPAVVRLGGADLLESQIVSWRRELITGITRPTATSAETERTFRLLGSSLRQRLFDPISVHLNGVTRVFVVPDGAVNLVPLAALPIRTSRYLLEDGPVIHYLSAERDSRRLPADIIVRGTRTAGGRRPGVW